MLDSPFLESLVCMVFVYGILSALASILQELQSQYLEIRPHFLVMGIRRMLSDDLSNSKNPSIKSELWDFFKRGLKILSFPATFPMLRMWTVANKIIGSNRGLRTVGTGASTPKSADGSSSSSSSKTSSSASTDSQPQLRKNLHADYLLVDEFFESGMIKYMGACDHKKPSYISQEAFTSTLVDICRLKKYPESEKDLEKIEFGPVLPTSVKSVLDAFIREAYRTTCHEKDVDCRQAAMDKKFRELISHWYEETMHRATGWYKRDAGKWLFWWGFAIALFLNADTFRLYRHFMVDSDARHIVKSQAAQFNSNSGEDNSFSQSTSDSIQTPMDSLHARLARHWNGEIKAMESTHTFGWRFPVLLIPSSASDSASNQGSAMGPSTKNGGWKSIGLAFLKALPGKLKIILRALPGLLATAVAVSFGAPFWFDLLTSALKLGGSGASARMSGVKPEGKKA